MEGQAEKNETIRQKINADESYTPYVARSSSDDLTYEQIIEVMEWLDEEEEKSVASYFHSQSSLHAIAESLELEFVRSWPSDRKLQLWKTYEKYEENTLTYARETREVLKNKRFPKRRE